jgi:hypothetical protein
VRVWQIAIGIFCRRRNVAREAVEISFAGGVMNYRAVARRWTSLVPGTPTNPTKNPRQQIRAKDHEKRHYDGGNGQNGG